MDERQAHVCVLAVVTREARRLRRSSRAGARLATRSAVSPTWLLEIYLEVEDVAAARATIKNTLDDLQLAEQTIVEVSS